MDTKDIDAIEKANDLGFHPCEPENKPLWRTYRDQMHIMLKRNTILQMRYIKLTLSQMVAAPIVFMLCLLILQSADYSIQKQTIAHPTPFNLLPISSCQGGSVDSPCINFMFTPNTAPFTTIMNVLAKKNAARTGAPVMSIENVLTDNTFRPTTKMGMVPVPDDDFIYQYTLRNNNVTEWGIFFNETTSPRRNIQYQIWYNSTQTINTTDVFGLKLVSLMRSLDEAIISVLNDESGTTIADLDVQLKDWPVLPPSTLSDTIIQQLGPVFFFCSVMVIFINVLNQIVAEKELKLRHALEVMGLKPSVYWVSQYLSYTVLVAANAFVTVIFGLICQFETFKSTNFGVLLAVFFLFGEAMVMFAFFLTTLVRLSRTAVLLGISIFIIGLLLESFVFSSSFVGYIWWDVDTTPIIWRIMIFIPFFNFGKIFLDITTMTVGRLDQLTQTYIPGPGFAIADLYETLPANLKPNYASKIEPPIPPPVESLYWFLMNIAFYAILTWYFDNVLPNEYGYRLPFWFPFSPKYWNITFSTSGQKTAEERQSYWLKDILKTKIKIGQEELDGEDEDVKNERLAAQADQFSAMKVVNLRKAYRGGLFTNSGKGKIAIKNLCMNYEEGKLLALLGQNGAGKSTTMNILSGLTPASAGDGNVYGYSVRTQMHKIREFMGICPQHDILFEDLTAREHIELYAGVKGIAKKDLSKLIESRLKAVKLWKVADQRAGTYSGGMKRRLSVAITTIGDPKVVFFDEPSSGMDPVNRRHVWSFIERFKQGRVVVLTTHSMEEADVLGDRIAIMAHGSLRAIGNSIHLKNTYGAGYRITVVAAENKIAQAKKAIESRVPEAKLEDDSAGSLIYQFPLSSTNLIPSVVKFFESNPEGLFTTWGVSQTTLEEVFLKIIREANPQGYSGYENTNADQSAEPDS